jgi:hypothetical protein
MEPFDTTTCESSTTAQLTPHERAAQHGLDSWWRAPAGMAHTIVYGKLLRSRYYQRWIVRCPYCGRTHTHTAGEAGQDPLGFLGGRIAHCHRGHYEIRLAPDTAAKEGQA